jgi:general secretion pathway protein G
MTKSATRLRTGEQGLTLLELLIVISILGLLAVLASVQLSGYLKRAKHDTARLQMNELTLALDLFQLDVGRYPTSQEGLRALLEQPPAAERWNGPYVKSETAITDPWDHEFRYTQRAEPPGYGLESYGADGAPGGDADNADITL